MSSIYIDPQVYTGRPVSPEGRLEKEMAVYDLLDELRIPYALFSSASITSAENS